MAPLSMHSQPHDQASRLRRLVEEHASGRTNARLISVTSGKGGVGKTNIAINIAISLAGRGQRVLLLDMDMGLSNADVLLNVETPVHWWHVVRGGRNIGEAIVPACGGIDLLSGGSGLSDLADLTEFERHRMLEDIATLSAHYDVMLLDCGAGISRSVLSFGLAAETVLVVTTPEPTALTDAYAMIKMLARHRTPPTIGVIVNQASDRHEATRVYERIAQVAARFLRLGVLDFGYVLQDAYVQAAVRQRKPVLVCHPTAPASACLAAVAAKVLQDEEFSAEPSLLRRVVNMFL